MMTNTEALFAETVSILESSHNQPYLFDEDIQTFADVAEELTHRGFKNSRGGRLTENSLRVMLHRLDDETKAVYRDKYYPEMWSVSHLEYSHEEKVRKSRLQFLACEIEAWKGTFNLINNTNE